MAQVELHDGSLDLNTGLVHRTEGPQRLSKTQLKVVRYLWEHQGTAVPRGVLLKEVWGLDPKTKTRTIDATMVAIRKKLEVDPTNPTHLLTIHGVGYEFRAGGANTTISAFSLGPWRIDSEAMVATQDSTTTPLTAQELSLLHCLFTYVDSPVDRQTLLHEVWGAAATQTRAVDNAIRRLRVKLEADPAEPQLLTTTHGFGYCLRSEPAPAVAPAGRLDVASGTLEMGDTLGQLDPDESVILRGLLCHPQGVALETLRLEAWGDDASPAKLRAVIHRLAQRVRIQLEDANVQLLTTITAQVSVMVLHFDHWRGMALANPSALGEEKAETRALLEPATWSEIGVDVLTAITSLDLAAELAQQAASLPCSRSVVWGEATIGPNQAPYGAALQDAVALARSAPVGTWATVQSTAVRAGWTGSSLGQMVVDGREMAPVVLEGPQVIAGLPVKQPTPGGVRLVGRDADLASLRQLLTHQSWITIIGPGGVGKTTLAKVFHQPGTHLVSLRHARDPQQIVDALAKSLDIPRATVSGVSEAINHRAFRLIILDNCEQLSKAAIDVLIQIRDLASETQLLATSRVALGVPGEQRFPLRPITNRHAADLFREHARLADPHFDAEDSDLDEVVQHLDGLPLAIILAAGRIDVSSLSRIRDRLAANPISADALRASLEWSWGLLSDEHQQLFMVLGVFEDGAAQDIALTMAGVGEGVWEDLQRHSLLQSEDLPRLRGRMLVAIQAFARQKAEQHESWPTWVQHHAALHLACLEECGPSLRYRGHPLLRRWQHERRNMVVAHQRTQHPGLVLVLAGYPNSRFDDPHVLMEALPQLTGAARQLGRCHIAFAHANRGEHDLASVLIDQVLNHPESDESTLAYVFWLRAFVDRLGGTLHQDPPMPSVSHPNDLAWCHYSVGLRFNLRNQFKEAQTQLHQARRLFQQVDNDEGQMMTMVLECDILYRQGQYASALPLCQEVAELMQGADLVVPWLVRQQMLANIHWALGNHATAKAHGEITLQMIDSLPPSIGPRVRAENSRLLLDMGENQRALALAQEANGHLDNNRGDRGYVLLTLGSALWANQQKQEAIDAWEEALRASSEHGRPHDTGLAEQAWAAALWHEGDHQAALVHQRKAVAAFASCNSSRLQQAEERLVMWESSPG